MMKRFSILLGLTLPVGACSEGAGPSDGNGVAIVEARAPAADNVETMTGATLAQFSGDAVAGQRVFLMCQTCHAIEPGANRLGPSLHGVVGRRAGDAPGYGFSEANRDSSIMWTPQKLFQFLENPRRVMPGTRMTFAGIADPQRRSDLIAYLATLR